MKILRKLLEPKDNGPEVAILLAELLNVKVSNGTLTKEILEHPDSQSILSISDVLRNYGIENLAIQFDPQKFSEIPTRFITQLSSEKRSAVFFTVVKDISGQAVNYFDPERHQWQTRDIADFLKNCNRIALLAEAGPEAGEKDYLEKMAKERNNPLSLCH